MKALTNNLKSTLCSSRSRAICGLTAAGVLAIFAGSAHARIDNSETDPLQHTRQMLAKNPNATHDAEAILVRFAPSLSARQKETVRAVVGGTKLQEWSIVPGLEQVKVVGDVNDAINAIKHLPGVMYAELDQFVHADAFPNDPSFGLLWGMHNTADTDIDAPQAWDVFNSAPNFVIADIDTGVNYNHPDLALNMWTNAGEVVDGIDNDRNGYIDDVRGWDFANNDNNPIDDQGHGTHTAGTFGAVGSNSIGVTGIMWRCKIMPLKFLDANGSGSNSGAISAIQYATRMNVKVSNNSWGGGSYTQALYDAISASQSVGHIFVAAAGNNGANSDAQPAYPAAYNLPNIISVIATDNTNQIASFSNYGTTSCDIAAPGVNIYSTFLSSYMSLSGTSMACPHVAGVVGLVYARNPSWTAAQVRTRVLSTARPVSALATRCATGGVVNALSALTGSTPPPPPPTNDLCTGSQQINVNASPGSVTFNTTGMNTDGPTPCSNLARDVWFRFASCVAGPITLNTCTDTGYDAVMTVYSGSCSALVQLGCNDDTCGLQPAIGFTAAANTTYYVRVGGYNGASGSGRLTFTGPLCQINPSDACTSAPMVSNGTYIGSNVGATTDGVGCAASAQDVWYAYQAPATGTLVVDTCTNASFDTVLSVHSGCPGDARTLLACNDDSAAPGCMGTLRSSVSLNVTAGTRYVIRVANYFSSQAGTYTLRVAGPIGPTGFETACPCDWNADSSVNSVDFFAFLGAFMAGSADFNQSGDTTTQDLFDYLDCFLTLSGSCL